MMDQEKSQSLVPKSNRKRRWLLRLVIILAVVMAGGFLVIGVGLYGFGWDNRVMNGMIKVVPYPVALVDFRIVRYADWRADFKSLTYFYTSQKSSKRGGIPQLSREQIGEKVLNRLIEDRVVIAAARRKGLSVSKTEIEKEFQTIVDQAGSLEQVEKTLEEIYRWNPKEFKVRVLTPFLFRQKLDRAIQEDSEVDAKVRVEAEEVLAKVQKGEKTFEELARIFSEDLTAFQGGDLGYLRQGEMEKSFEDTAFTLEVGTVSDLVKTRQGYHILKVEEKVSGKTAGEPAVVRVRHILIRAPSLESWLKEEIQKSRILRFVKIL